MVYEHVSPRRIWLLVRGDFIADSRRLALIAAIAAGAVLLASVLAGSSSFTDSAFHRKWFVILLFVLGLPASSHALRPFHDRNLKEPYLLIPASTLEKALARLLGTTVILTALTLAFCLLLSLVVEALNLFVFFGHRRPLFDPLAAALWPWIAAYVFVQSPYFLGSAWFRRWPGLKTTLVLVIALFVLAVSGFLGEPILRFLLDSDDWAGRHGAFRALTYFSDANADIVYTILILTPPALWCLAWLRLRKIQADDAI
ncbi:MAG: hypothetical protein OXC28_21505 [Defluviicoccus sp.]|nr:hypothetical protein [Defluviicoccus sp.]